MKQKRKIHPLLPIMAATILLAVLAFSRLDEASNAQDLEQLTQALRRGAVACYAQEGFYPPDINFLLDYSGVRYDPDRYWIHYEIFASNLMPDITVVEKNHGK